MKISSLIMMCLALFAAVGCSILQPGYSDVTISVHSSGTINDGVLLPLDIITVSESKAESVLAITPDEWFGSDLRERLSGDEIQKLAISGGGSREVEVRVPSNVGRIIIYADYENRNERAGQQIIIAPEHSSSFHSRYDLMVKENSLELKP